MQLFERMPRTEEMGYGEYLLRHYQEIKAHVAMLELNLANLRALTADEMIEAMALRRSDGERRGQGGVSDKTAVVAAMYRETVDRLNSEIESGRRSSCVTWNWNGWRQHYRYYPPYKATY